MHSGDYEAAQRFFRAGYERCPQYPMVTEHLAEIEGRLGHLKRSTELYESVVTQTQHPEFMAALAEIYIQRGMTLKAEDMINQAKRRFAHLEALAPEAMSAHAADFYRGLGNSPQHALKLLTRNHTLRPNAHAKQALADILIELGHYSEAEKLVSELLMSPVEFAEKYWTAAKLALAQKKEARAKEHAKKARELNPRIADLEGELVVPVGE
jgi:tetratricopeptide (TPR) repeat protein